MSAEATKNQPSVPTSDRGLFVLSVYALLITLGFGLLSQTHSLWVFFAPGPTKLIWVACLLVVTVGLALLPWHPPSLPKIPILPISFALTIFIAFWVLQRFENSADEYAYIFEAQTYLSGHLWTQAPPLGQALAADYTWVKDDRWVGQYPPGWPVVLGLFHLLGLPYWLVNPLIALATLWFFRKLSPNTPSTLALFALCPFTVFNGASYHSHMLAACLGLIGLFCLEHSRKPGWAMMAGFALGWVGLTRYISAALLALPFGLSQLIQRRWVTCLLILLGLTPPLIALLLYHQAITGNALTPVYYLSGRNADHLYFDLPHLKEAITITCWRWLELAEWAGPGIIPLWGLILWDKIKSRTLRPEDFVFMVFVLTFMAYPFDGANRYGPRYYFEAFPFLLLSLSRTDWKPLYHRLAFLSILYGLLALPWLATYYHQIVTERLDLSAQVTKLGLTHAVVLVEDGPGQIWKMEPDDMARNGLTADGSVLYARADKVDIATLKEAFPDRALWIYHRLSADGPNVLSAVTTQ